MLPLIGQTVMYKGIEMHVQDTCCISQSAKIGVVDINDVVWEPMWVPFEEITIITEK